MLKSLCLPAALVCLTVSAVAGSILGAGSAIGEPALSHQPATTCTAPDGDALSYGSAQVPYTNIDATPDGALVYQMPTNTEFRYCNNTATKVGSATWVYGFTASSHIKGWVNKGRLVELA